ncbi:uncharacterized protein LOC114423462 [Glycine soja]|uniref:Uncharacterized protein n=1 Tax=Glycine soja TaxID=3848 RepID=A0A445JN78_GLYSO|nr:uncharacterized protein LOC114423462 [Glycine soja]RZB99847.1 hypothetical protein D0Y65_022310 [Glycine soja]
MEAVGSRLSRATSRYGAPTVFSGPVRKWKKKWVHVTPSSLPNNNSHSHTNNFTTTTTNDSSRLLLRRWTPTTADDSAGAVSDDPPRRKFRYTPIAVLEEQKKMNVVKAEHEPTIEADQLAFRQTNVTHEMQGKLNMNEMLEETKDSNIGNLDLGSDFQSNTGEKSHDSDSQLENSI